jgi:AmmeMemoRadiSam system protein B
MTRSPAVAGSFYPGDPGELASALQTMTRPSASPAPAVGVMVPHAGYVYSGGVAGQVFSSVQLPRRFIILCPNHTGRGEPLAIDVEGEWRTPLGTIPVDAELAGDLAGRFPALRHDTRAHEREHSLEVQLPFLQHMIGDFRFVPICVMTHDREELIALGQAMAGAVRECADPVLVVISSDMSHYEPAEAARRKDMRALARIEAMDPEGLHRTVHGEGISMCGIAPAVAGVAAARELGATRGTLVTYANSGDVSGDMDQVVGYAGVVLGPETA